MAKEGTTVSYTANAQSAAALSKPCGGSGCPACVKAGLPVLLVRPGLADKKYADAHKDAIAPLLAGVADPQLTASGYVMRTLRQGYLYAYYEKWPAGQIQKQKGWEVFRVDDGGYLTPIPLEAAGTPASEFACQRSESYATAMLYVIQDAKNVGKVWVGFSSSPWSENTRRLYSSNEKRRNQRMACIDASSGSAQRGKALTADNIVQCVADYDPKLEPVVLKGNPFPRRIPAKEGQTNGANAQPSPTAMDAVANSKLFPGAKAKARPEDAALVQRQAQDLIARIPNKPYTDKNLLIVSVPDAEGVTTEAAQLRITLCNTANEWASEPGKADRLRSALQIEGMYKLIEQSGEDRKTKNAKFAHLNDKKVTHKEFEAMKEAGQLPEEAWFSPDQNMTPNPLGITVEDPNNGTIVIPGAKQIDYQTSDMLKKFEDGLSKQGAKLAYRQFLATYRARVDADEKRLKELEKDYGAWLQSDARKLVTTCDFDENTPVDGVHYCACVANVTLGGPITDQGQDWFKPFLSEDPNDKEALLTRALLGNQASSFAWYTALDPRDVAAKIEEKAKDVLDLVVPEAKQEILKDTAVKALSKLAQTSTQQVQQVTGAVMAKLEAAGEKAGQLSEKLRYQHKLLTMHLMSNGERLVRECGKAGVTLMKAEVNLAEAVKLWNVTTSGISKAMSSAGQVGQRKVESLLINGAALIEANGSPKAGLAVVEVYLWVTDPAKVGQGVKAAGTSALKSAEIYGDKVVRYVHLDELLNLTRISARTLGSVSGVMSTGFGVLQAMLMAKAWRDYGKGNDQERLTAATGLLAAGLGVSAAALELSARALQVAEKEALAQGVKKLAGFISAGATAMDGVQAAINAYRAGQDGDDGAKWGYRIQAGLFFGAAVAGVFAAGGGIVGAGGAVLVSAGMLIGLSLILVALGVIVGLIILWLKDRPVETWAKKMIHWGTAPDRWKNPNEEVQEANKVLLCAQLDFSYRWNVGGNLLTSVARAGVAEMGGMSSAMNDLPFEREAWLRLKLPQKLRQRLPWTMRIYANQNNRNEVLVGKASFDGTGNVSRVGGTSAGVGKQNFSEESSDGIVTMEFGVMLDTSKFTDARAKVEVYVQSSQSQEPLLIIDGDLTN